MVLLVVRPPVSAGPLSRIGDYLLAAQGPGLVLWIRRRITFPHASAFTRGPPYPLFHRRHYTVRAVLYVSRCQGGPSCTTSSQQSSNAMRTGTLPIAQRFQVPMDREGRLRRHGQV